MSHVDTASPITHVSLCAGYGGIDLGLKRAIPSLRTIAFSEIESFACANLVAKMEAGLLDCAPIWTNLKTFPWAEFRDRVDILTGGYPCQPFSAAGKRLGTEDPRHLWPFIADGIRLLRPKLCFFENVEGHISLGLSTVISDLEELGYKVSWGIFSASEVGAPHQRKRVFILAYDTSVGIQGCGAGWLQESRPHAGQALPLRGGDAGGGELANALCDGSGEGRFIQQGSDGAKPVGDGESRRDAWPSRPGEQQFWWEPPRVVVDAKSQRTGQRSELRSEECGSRSALPRDIEQPSEAALANDHRAHTRHGEQRPERTLRDLSGGCGEAGAMGNAEELRRPRLRQDNAGDINEQLVEPANTGRRQTQPALGRDADGPADWLDDAELFTTCDNRTDELRLLGNGVVPATAERAFRTLVSELMEHANQ